MPLYYNPTDKKCKSIIGAISSKDRVELSVYADASEVVFKFYCDKTQRYDKRNQQV